MAHLTVTPRIEIDADADTAAICVTKQRGSFSVADWKRCVRAATDHYLPLLDPRDRAVIRRPDFWRLVAGKAALP